MQASLRRRRRAEDLHMCVPGTGSCIRGKKAVGEKIKFRFIKPGLSTQPSSIERVEPENEVLAAAEAAAAAGVGRGSQGGGGREQGSASLPLRARPGRRRPPAPRRSVVESRVDTRSGRVPKQSNRLAMMVVLLPAKPP